MTRIRRCSVWTHRNDLGGKVWNPAIVWTEKYAVFVTLEDDQGYTGLGECWCFDSSPKALAAYLETEVVPQILGAALEDIDEILDRLTTRATLTARHGMLASAAAGIDMAAWDLRSRQSGVPLWKSLNPSGPGTATLYASGGLYGHQKGVRQLTEEMSAMSSTGFQLVKMKVGGLPIEDDVARTQAVLNALPENTKLIIDGVYRYGADEALKLFEQLPADRIEAFQSPVAAKDIAGMALLSRSGVPVMATESEYREEVHRLLVDEAKVAFLQTAPIACGGISRVRSLSTLVEKTSTRLSLEVSSTAIALMAACHLAAASKTVAHVERHFVHQVFFEDLRLKRHPDFPDRFMTPETPGLGIELRQDEVTRAFELTSSDLVQEPQTAAH